MAKIPFTKLALSRNNDIKEIEWNNQKIEIKQYLPANEKLNLISRIVNFTNDDHVFYNPCKVEIFEIIEIILAYTNINITEKQQEDTLKLYDLLISSGFAELIKDNIPLSELEYIHNSIWAIIKEIYRYRDSFIGVIEQVQQSYQDLDIKVNELEEKISNPDNLNLLKQVVTSLG